jgi:hypothetical protein
MRRFFLEKTSLSVILGIACLIIPFGANAQAPSGITGWLSSIFNWQAPIVSHISDIFEARKDNVESNSIARDQLLDWRRGTVVIDASSSDASSAYGADSGASSSPVFISYGLFEEKRSSIVVELMTAENGLENSASDLAGFIAGSAANGNDMSAARADLDQADADIDAAGQAIDAFENYEPDTASSSAAVDLKVPQSYLEAAIAAIQTAKASLSSAIAATDSSL